jgi:hypothetical protein
MTDKILHITSGDAAGELIKKTGVKGELLVWHDILYDGPRKPGWPDDDILNQRAKFLSSSTGKGLTGESVLETLKSQYQALKSADNYNKIILWFDACLFDQSMLCHILSCLEQNKHPSVNLLCIDSFPGISPYHGIGQLTPDQLKTLVGKEKQVTSSQVQFAQVVDEAFSNQDRAALKKLSETDDGPLPWIRDAVTRCLQEIELDVNGLGRLERTALEAIRSGCRKAREIYRYVSDRETPPQYWGDITLWEKINQLSITKPPLVRINGPLPMLPQWNHKVDLDDFDITPVNE